MNSRIKTLVLAATIAVAAWVTISTTAEARCRQPARNLGRGALRAASAPFRWACRCGSMAGTSAPRAAGSHQVCEGDYCPLPPSIVNEPADEAPALSPR